jgi:hypothetical protein
VRRGVLNPLAASPPGSVWWRAVNGRLLRDGCEAVALVGDMPGEPSSRPVRLWLECYIGEEQRLGRLLDYSVIVPRLQRVYEWSAVELGEPRLLELVRDGNPVYAWPFEERHVWRSPHMRPVGECSSAPPRPGDRQRWIPL